LYQLGSDDCSPRFWVIFHKNIYFSAFPNFEVDFEQSENVNIDTQKVEVEIAKNCQKLTELIKDLDDHYLKQLAEMEEDLGARQEKQLGRIEF
jgi:hypothetical protein